MQRVKKTGYHCEVDLWSLGVVVYVMLAGKRRDTETLTPNPKSKTQTLNLNSKPQFFPVNLKP